MFEITVKKSDLIAVLIKNRDEHKYTFQAAMEKYREVLMDRFNQVMAEANARIDTLKSGLVPEQAIVFNHLPVPEEHVDDFDRTIDMLRMDINDTVTLDETQYDNYVNNNWHWGRTFAINTASYVGNR